VASTTPLPDEVKELRELAKEGSAKKAPAARDVSRAGGKTIGIDAATRPRYEHGDRPLMHHLWTIDLDEVPELRRFSKFASARAAALFIHDRGDNECIRVVALLDAGLREAVAAGRARTGVQTGVGVAPVRIVALLDAGVHDAIAARRTHARGTAAVGLAGVAVIAGLDGGLTPALGRG
jgi:hypothetical protein